MSKTPVSTSGEVIVAVASHLSNVPSIATDAFTWNLIELSSFVILMTGTPAGACARLTDGSTAEAKRHRTTNRMKFLGWRQKHHSSGEAVMMGHQIPLSKVTGRYARSRTMEAVHSSAGKSRTWR